MLYSDDISYFPRNDFLKYTLGVHYIMQLSTILHTINIFYQFINDRDWALHRGKRRHDYFCPTCEYNYEGFHTQLLKHMPHI